MKSTTIRSLLHATGVLIYVLLLATLFINIDRIFSESQPPEILIIPFMLMLFIVSASITSFLVLGKPIALFFDGSRKKALYLFLSTLGWLVMFLAVLISTMLLLS